jgi:hypothetical protein
MAATQQDAQDSSLPDEEREGLLERIQSLSVAEIDAKQRVEDAEKVRHFSCRGECFFMTYCSEYDHIS